MGQVSAHHTATRCVCVCVCVCVFLPTTVGTQQVCSFDRLQDEVDSFLKIDFTSKAALQIFSIYKKGLSIYLISLPAFEIAVGKGISHLVCKVQRRFVALLQGGAESD